MAHLLSPKWGRTLALDIKVKTATKKKRARKKKGRVMSNDQEESGDI